MKYYTKDVVINLDGTEASANNTFDTLNEARAYFYSRMGTMLKSEKVQTASMTLQDSLLNPILHATETKE